MYQISTNSPQQSKYNSLNSSFIIESMIKIQEILFNDLIDPHKIAILLYFYTFFNSYLVTLNKLFYFQLFSQILDFKNHN